MSRIKAGLRYSKEHEWAEDTGSGIVRVGISDFAQSELGDIVFVELPEIGTAVAAGASLGTIESVKTVSDLYAPAAGRVVRVNTELLDAPERVNEEPYEGGWIVDLEISGTLDEAGSGLLSAEEYEEYTAAL